MRSRPSHWDPPGPIPPGAKGIFPELRPQDGETLDCLSGHWKIFQLRRGHRYSTDDLLTAWYAASVHYPAGAPASLLDLGCGIGSVGLLLLWRFPLLQMVGIEAQARSASLARRSVQYNGVGQRGRIIQQDLRNRSALIPGEYFTLITASPPYLRQGEGHRSTTPQRGPCRFEERGGVEEYLRTAVQHLEEGGTVVWIHATRYTEANLAAATACGLIRQTYRPVVFREGKESLVTLFRADKGSSPEVCCEPPLTVRGKNGTWTEEYREIRREMGFPV